MIFAIIFLILNSCLVAKTEGCSSEVKQATWQFLVGRDHAHAGVNSANDCRLLCLQGSNNFTCQGYTWVKEKVVNYCYLFGELENIQLCEGCESGSVPRYLPSGQYCEAENILAEDRTDSAQECSELCKRTQNCNVFTWFVEDSPFFHNTCFMYESCEEVSECGEYCVSANLNCIHNKQCYEYTVLNEENRNVNFKGDYGTRNYLGDHLSSSHCSPLWRGAGYYRFLPPAGTKLPEVAPGWKSCHTEDPVWMESPHPDVQYIETDVTFCEQQAADECHYKYHGTVTLCDNYIVYYLEDIDSYTRYCPIM